MGALRYSPSYLIPTTVLIGSLLAGWWVCCTPLLVFVVIPLMELWVGPNALNLNLDEELRAKKQLLYSWILWSFVPIQLGLTYFVLWTVTVSPLSILEVVGLLVSLGINNGATGITIAHELVHRRSKFEQILGRILLMTTWYMHFAIEHIRGHHVHVATASDSATAPMHTSFYRFWLHTVPHQWLSAWRLESQRLLKLRLSSLSLRNEMLWFMIVQIIFTAGLGWLLGSVAVVGFLLSCLVAFSLLEAVNYLEHYGLERRLDQRGRPERVNPEHSWNSDHQLSRHFLFELSRHSDHHAVASRKYQTLRSFEHSPQLPTGYPGMIVLALIPPLWFAVMNPLVEKQRHSV